VASTRRWLDRGNPRDAGARHACQGIFTDNEKALAYAGAFPLSALRQTGSHPIGHDFVKIPLHLTCQLHNIGTVKNLSFPVNPQLNTFRK